MFGDGSLTFREFIMREPLPLATIHDAVLEFLRGRTDAVLFGAHAVNAYVEESRMTQDVDILSPRAPELAEELRAHLTRALSDRGSDPDRGRRTRLPLVPIPQAEEPSPRGRAERGKPLRPTRLSRTSWWSLPRT